MLTTYADPMGYLRDLMRECEIAVRNHLGEEEQALASGRCADISTTGDLDSAGAGWTYVMVTDRHIHWVPDIRKLGLICSLDLDQVQSCTEVHWRHRSAVAMHHDPLTRLHFVPNGRPLNWTYTMESAVGPQSTTILGFSRPTAKAAVKLKEQVALRGLVVAQVRSRDRLP